MSNLGILVIAMAMLVVPAAADRMSFQDYLNEAKQCPGGTTKDFPNYTVFVCDKGLTYYIITKPNHPAHPGVITRKMVTKDGATSMETEGHSFKDDDRAFRDWMTHFKN